MNCKNKLIEFETENKILLPSSYKEILNLFNIFRVYSYQNKELNIYSIARLFSTINNACKLHEFMQGELSTSIIDTDKTFTFGSLSDGIELFFDLRDMSIWRYYLDDNTIAQIESSFEELINKSTLIASE